MKTIESILEKHGVVADVDYEVIANDIFNAIITEEEIEMFQFAFNELIRKSNHDGNETYFKKYSECLTRLRSFL